MSIRSTKLNVIFEDNHLLVIDKPPLLATMGVREQDVSLVVQARRYLKEKYNKPGNVYLGVVSRLDAFVSGVIVLARTSKSASRLTEQFRNRSVEKKYWALVPRGLGNDSGQLEDRLIKNESRHRMEVLAENSPFQSGEKNARLSYRVIGRHGDVELLEIDLETGRKHQIRVQLEHAGCPIIGDKKYGSQLPFRKGIALHAQSIVIDHPTLKTRHIFRAEPPPWWAVERFNL